MRYSAWYSAESSISSEPSDRSSSQLVISKPCIGPQLNALSTSTSSVPFTTGSVSATYLSRVSLQSLEEDENLIGGCQWLGTPERGRSRGSRECECKSGV